jgi:hypothetical protein
MFENSRSDPARVRRPIVASIPALLAPLARHWTRTALKTAEQLEDARRMRRAERIWALRAVCTMVVAVSIYVATIILCRRHGLIGY